MRSDDAWRFPARLFWLAAGLILAFVLLTLGDILATITSLRLGMGVELNPNAARAGGGLRISFLVLSNTILLVPLLGAFVIGLANAARIPQTVLANWWRHVVDVFYIKPMDDRARARSPLRLVTATMTLLTLKVVILANNLLALRSIPGPVSLLAGFATHAGLDGSARYWCTYLLLVLPCYVVAVGIAAHALAYVARAESAQDEHVEKRFLTRFSLVGADNSKR